MGPPRRFLAINDLPGATAAEVRGRFERLVEEGRALGLRPVETFYSLERGRAYTYVEGDAEDHVRAMCAAAGLPVVDVVPGERLYTELLDEPKRYR